MSNFNEKYYITVNGEEIVYYKIDNDVNGNSRSVVHFLDLNVMPKDYGKIKGLVKYRAKWFGGGYVFQSSAIRDDLQWMLNTVKKYYERVGK